MDKFPDLIGLKISLVMVGRLFASFGFGLVYLYTSELFPTEIRSTAVGISSTIARFGGIIAILMEPLNNYWPPFTMVVFGIVALIAAPLALIFPETVDDKLPDSIEESLSLGKNVKRNKFGLILRQS